MATRAIRYDPECDSAAEALGGYEAIDETLDVYWEPYLETQRDLRSSSVHGEVFAISERSRWATYRRSLGISSLKERVAF